MAYSTNPSLPKARAFAMQLLICEQLPLQTVANRCGVHRVTIWRWKRKWDTLNERVQMDNPNRPRRAYSRANHLLRCTWRIPTLSSRPHSFPQAISEEIVQRVLALRQQLKRCAEVVWYYLAHVGDAHGDVVKISLSSVRRILRRHHCFDGARKKRARPDSPRRPVATRPGELVEIDTIHHVDPRSGKRLYYYTAIDLYSRMTHVTVSTVLRQGLAAKAILAAREAFGFPFAIVQTDNGPEFQSYFERELKKQDIQTRHTRLGRPNDNAHIERFNRTLQEECIGHYWRRSVPLQRQRETLSAYLDYYNTKRVHLGIQMRVPREMLQRF